MVKALITGGRDFSDQQFIYHTLDILHERYKFELIVHGDAKGADRLSGQWADEAGVQQIKVPANWVGNGARKAGPMRNQFMYDLIHPDICIAFPGGTGTANMMKICYDADIIVIYTEEPL